MDILFNVGPNLPSKSVKRAYAQNVTAMKLSILHYPIFQSDVHGFNCSSTSHLTKGIL